MLKSAAVTPRRFGQGEQYLENELIYGPTGNSLYRVKANIKVAVDRTVDYEFSRLASSMEAIDQTLASPPVTTTDAQGNVIIVGLPTSDPGVNHALWNNAGVLSVSAGE